MRRKNKIKGIVCFILGFSIILNGCESTAGLTPSQTQMVNQQNNEITEIVVGTVAFTVLICTLVIVAVHGAVKKQKVLQAIEEAKFQACVGKPKSEIYALYGPPNSIVDDGLNDGGNILEYLKVVSYGGGDNTSVTTTTYRKLFYLNKDNIVIAVKEDTQ